MAEGTKQPSPPKPKTKGARIEKAGQGTKYGQWPPPKKKD